MGQLIVFEGTVLDDIKLALLSALGNISIIISNHLVEEGLGLVGGSNLHALVLHNIDNGDALVVELLLDLLLVGGETIIEFLVFWVLLDGADGPNGGSL